MYVVTGGAGFIGSVFVEKLNREGINDILVVDRLGSTEKWRNIQKRRVSDVLHCDTFLKKIENESLPGPILAIVHLGACSSTLERNADYLLENNYRYTRTLAEYCVRNNVRFIYASSAATYGDGSASYSDSEGVVDKLHPLNLYGYSKQLLDQWVVHRGYTQRMVGLKFFNVYGPNEYHKTEMRSVVHKAYEQIRQSGRVKLFKSYLEQYKDGEQKRDFVYVKDCADSIWWLLHQPRINGIFNFGAGKARSWNELVTAIFSALKLDPKIDYIEMPQELRTQYQYFTEAPMDKLKNVGCKLPQTSLEDGVKDYVLNYLEKPDRYL